MNFFIVYFLPSVLGLYILKNFNKEQKYFDLILNYFMFVLFSNLFCMIILILKGIQISNLSNLLELNFIFSFKYIIISMVINIILAFLSTILGKYLEISIEVENGRKTKKKKNRKSN